MRTPSRLGMIVLMFFWLAGCTAGFFPGNTLSPETATPAASVLNTPNSTGVPSGTPVKPETAQATPGQAQSTPPAGVHLVIWLPPEFDPNSGSPAAGLLKARLKAFADQNPGIQVEVRVKALTGQSGLLDSLLAASAAAPRALPDLIALPRPDLEAAALKGLLTPLDGLSKAMDDPDWFTFSRQLATISSSYFGMPFAADALLLLYRPSHVSGITPSWTTILHQSSALAFPAADPQSLVTLAFYLGEGGAVEDKQGRPTLSAEQLTQVLKTYSTGNKQGVFPYWLSQVETDDQSWQAYRDQKSQLVISWVTRYLSEKSTDIAATPLPSSKNGGLTLATGWLWALSNPRSTHKAESAKLAEFLVQSDFLAKWTEAAGYLPTRPTALAGWKNQEKQALLSPVAMSGQALPDVDVLAGVGPALEEATLQMIKNQGDPSQAADTAVKHFKNP
jgi:multiple sugar transport system substrate-binding protein